MLQQCSNIKSYIAIYCSKDVFLHIKNTWFGFLKKLFVLSSKQLLCLLPISDVLISCAIKNSIQNTLFIFFNDQ